MSRKVNNKGRSSNSRFIQIPYYLLNSEAYRSLSCIARGLFTELLMIFNGANNGNIALSARDAKERLGCSKSTANRAFHELIEKGFIEVGQPGAFSLKMRHATEWRLTLHECHRTNKAASKAFMTWKPPETSAARTRKQNKAHIDLYPE